MLSGPPEVTWFAWLTVVGPFLVVATSILTLWLGVKIQGRISRYVASRNLPRMQVVVRDPLGRPRVFY